MAIDIEVSGFTGGYAALNAPAVSYPVGMAEVVNRCVTVGGPVVGSARHRTYRRSAIANTVLSAIRPQGPPSVASPLEVTPLFVNTETTEKTGMSFRLGMGFAAIAASRVLKTPALEHVAVPGVPVNGRRADLIGLDKLKATHVVEAKARSHGVTQAVLLDGKQQAQATANALILAGTAVATASVAVTDLSVSPIHIYIEDPPVDFSGQDDEEGRREQERALAENYYRAVEDLLEVKPAERSGFDEVDAAATGAWMPGSNVWLGLRNDVRSELATATLDLREERATIPASDPWLMSSTPDGHVVVLGPRAVLPG